MGGYKSQYEGGRPGRRTATTPKSISSQALKRQVSHVLALGTSSVSTQTKLVGIMPVEGKVVGISYAGQAAVTGTSLTANVQKLSADGNTATSLQASATDIKLTASTDEVQQDAALTATTANLTVAAGSVLQVVITADTVSAGPGDLVVEITYVPTEDVKVASEIETGADLL